MSVHVPGVPVIPERHLRLMAHWLDLEGIYAAYGAAEASLSAALGVPLCVPDCGHCCRHNSVLALGIEAEYVVSHLLGNPRLSKRVSERCRHWLTKPGRYTHGRRLDMALLRERQEEWAGVLSEPCPLLDNESRCIIHECRPLVCRAYGVTRMAALECKRHLGNGEAAHRRAYIDGRHPTMPLHAMVASYRSSLVDPTYSREGFLVTMIFEQLHAKELAGLLDDGKVPIMKLAQGWGRGILLLWQEQLEATWNSRAADRSIAEQVPLKEVDGLPVMEVGGRSR